MKTFTGVALAQSSGFISRQAERKIRSLVSVVSESKAVSNRTALRLVLKDGAVMLKPVARNYLLELLGVCDD